MLLPLLPVLVLNLTDPPVAYIGRAGQLEVRIPRYEHALSVDGQLGEMVWGRQPF
jgi:hypothetical protein